MDEKQQKMYDALLDCDAETIVNAFLDWHGTQLLDDGFYKHLEDEGIIYG